MDWTQVLDRVLQDDVLIPVLIARSVDDRAVPIGRVGGLLGLA